MKKKELGLFSDQVARVERNLNYDTSLDFDASRSTSFFRTGCTGP